MNEYGIGVRAQTKTEHDTIAEQRRRPVTDGPIRLRRSLVEAAPDGTPVTVFGVSIVNLTAKKRDQT